MIHVFIPHKYFEGALRAICRVLFPARMDGWQAPPDNSHIIQAAESFDKSVGFRVFVPECLLFAVVLPFLYVLPRLVRGAPQNPIFQDHEHIQLIIIAAMWTGTASMMLIPLAAERYWGVRLQDYYDSTSFSRQYNRRRAQWFGRICATLPSIATTAIFWNEGTLIDANGIRMHEFLHRPRIESYAQVRGIGLFQQYRDLFGLKESYNIRIMFADGTPFDLNVSESGERPEVLDAIAKYVSERSGKPILQARIRPYGEWSDVSVHHSLLTGASGK